MTTKSNQQTIEIDNLEKLRECFIEFDEDGDDLVQTTKLGSMIEYLHFPLPDDFVEKTFIQFQLKENQKFTFDKFCEFLEPRHRNTQTWQKLHDAFQVFDNNGNGKISISDLSEILTTFGNVFTSDEVNHMKAISKPDENDLIDINLITDLLVDDMLDNLEEEEEEEENGNDDTQVNNNLTEQSSNQRKDNSDHREEYSNYKESSNYKDYDHVEKEYVEYEEEEEEVIDNKEFDEREEEEEIIDFNNNEEEEFYGGQ